MAKHEDFFKKEVNMRSDKATKFISNEQQRMQYKGFLETHKGK